MARFGLLDCRALCLVWLLSGVERMRWVPYRATGGTGAMLLHPMIVHFPIALLVASVVLDALGVGFRRASLTQAGFYTLIGGSLGATAAVLSGPEHTAKDAASLTILHRHELFAALMVLCCLILVGMRLGNAGGLYGPGAAGYLALGGALIVCIVLTGYFGGQMVYDRGVGVSELQGARIPSRDAVQEMWAKLGGIALVVVIVGWTLARSRFLLACLRDWWQATRSGVPTEQPTLWTLGLARPVPALVVSDQTETPTPVAR